MNVVNFLGYQAGWFACVLGAAHDQALLGSAIGGALVALHLAWQRPRSVAAILVLAAAAVGAVAESIQYRLGVTHFAESTPWAGLCPLWMIMLWALFGTTLDSSLRWLQTRPWWATAAGVVGGPIAYFGGERLGALRLHDDRLFAALSVATVYGVATPALLTLARRISRSPAVAERGSR